MRRFTPAELRAGTLHFLLDLTWGGIVYRVAEQSLQPTLDGETLEYVEGLEVAGSWEDRIDLFGPTTMQRSTSVSVNLDGIVDVPTRIKDGHPLGAATAVLKLWLSGTTTTQTVLSGGLRGVQHAEKEKPIKFKIEEAPLISTGRIPSELQRISPPAEVSNLVPSVHGFYYPIVFGRPGGSGGYGSPALFHAVLVGFTSSVTIAAHACVAGTVKVVNASTGATETASVIVESDGNVTGPRTRRTAVDLTSLPASADDANKAHYVQWTAGNAGGLPSRIDPTVPMRNAGEILVWLLEQSGARVDHARMELLIALLAGFRLDAAIVPGDKERVDPLMWVQDHLLPVLPLSARMSSAGLYYVAWQWGATASDAVTSISVDDHQAERVGDVEYSESDDTYQAVRLNYALDYAEDTHQSTLTYTGDPLLAAVDSTYILDRDLARSFALHAKGDPKKVKTLERSTGVVLDDATAHLVCQQLARRHALQSRLVHYEADMEFAWLEPGAVIKITDEDIGLSSQVAIVETTIQSRRESVGLGLRIF